MTEFLNNALFIFQRLNWLGIIDILLVTSIFFGVLYLVRDTQAMLLLRGIIFILILFALLTSLVNLPAFSWLIRTVLPAMVFAIPVIFAPEIRRALERIGRAGTFFRVSTKRASQEIQQTIQAVVGASARLSARQHGALIVLERFDHLDEYIRTGVMIQADVTPEMLMQIFYPNTPLHDGAVIISGNKIIAAACVMPLSSSGILARSPNVKWDFVTAPRLVFLRSAIPSQWLSPRRLALLPLHMPGKSFAGWMWNAWKISWQLSSAQTNRVRKIFFSGIFLTCFPIRTSNMLRWITTNLRTFLLAFALALAVWVTAVTANNPDVTQAYSSPIPIEFIGQDPGLVMTGTVPRQVQVTLRAPRSIWDTSLSSGTSIRAVVDLTGLKAGTQAVEVQVQIAARPVRIISITPQRFNLSLEKLVTIAFPVELTISGKPAIGYKAGDVVINPTEAIISGAESIVAQVKHVHASLDITNYRQSIETTLPIQAVDESGSPVEGISINSSNIQVSLPIIQQGGYRDIAVKVIITGKLASGYRLRNITASPLIVTVYSEDLRLIESLPGYVETSPLDLSGASSNIETHLSLNLPSGVMLIGDQTVSVQIEIVPIEDSRQVSFRQVEVIGLGPGLQAQLSPTTLDVILAGPLPILNSLQPSDVLVRIDLTGLNIGTYQLTPTVNVAGQGVTVQSILPGTVEVIITRGTGASATPKPTSTLTPTPTFTLTPWPTLVPTQTPAP